MGKNILIIDNDKLQIDDLLTSLNGVRCCVKVATTGLKGMQMLLDEYYDFVIIDMFALGFDGKEVAKHIRLKRKNKSPIIFGLSDKANQIRNGDINRIFSSPISAKDFHELRNNFINPVTV